MYPTELLEDHSRLVGCLFSGTSGESTQPDLVGQYATCGSEEEVTISVSPAATYCVKLDPWTRLSLENNKQVQWLPVLFWSLWSLSRLVIPWLPVEWNWWKND